MFDWLFNILQITPVTFDYFQHFVIHTLPGQTELFLDKISKYESFPFLSDTVNKIRKNSLLLSLTKKQIGRSQNKPENELSNS